MKGMSYLNSGNSVQVSFQKKSHENLSIGLTASVSSVIKYREVILSLVVAAHVRISDQNDVAPEATVSDMVIPAGLWPILIPPYSRISVIQLTNSDAGQASVIIPEG